MISVVLANVAAVAIAIDPLSPLTPQTALSPRMAVVSGDGVVLVSAGGGAGWTPVHDCARDRAAASMDEAGEAHGHDPGSPAPSQAWAEPVSDRARCAGRARGPSIAWYDHALYSACAGGALFVWQPGETHSQPVVTAPMAAVVALGTQLEAGDRLLIVDADAALWAYSRVAGFEYLASTPGRAGGQAATITGVAAYGGEIVVADATSLWRRRGVWQPMIGIAACALAAAPPAPGTPARLWVAGPHGILELSRARSDSGQRGWDDLSVRAVAPALGVAFFGGQIFVVDGRRVAIMPVPAPVHGSTPLYGPAGAVDSDGHLPGDSVAARRLAAHAAPISWAGDPAARELRAMERRRRWARWLPRLSASVIYRQRLALDITFSLGSRVELWMWLTWTVLEESYR